jgi:outer membrane lipoprotein SlyB
MPDTPLAQHHDMAQATQQSVNADRYGDVALGVECAWPKSSGDPAAVQGFSPSSSPKGNSGVGVAFSLATALLLGTALVAGAAPYAPEEYDFTQLSSLHAPALGTVESVREVPLQAEPAGLRDVLEHALNPDTAEQLVVRLDDGRALIIVLDGAQRFQPGERVRVVGGRVLRT